MTAEYEISTEPGRLDLAKLHRWLSTDAYWAIGRSRETVAAAVRNSVNFGAYRDGVMVAFARLVTDDATFAWLCDVYVDPAERGRGLGRRLVAAARDHARERGLRRIMLATDDAHGLYAEFGFRPLAEPWKWMELRLADK